MTESAILTMLILKSIRVVSEAGECLCGLTMIFEDSVVAFYSSRKSPHHLSWVVDVAERQGSLVAPVARPS